MTHPSPTASPHLNTLDETSVNQFLIDARETELYLLQNYKRALASRFIQYFDAHPDAILFIHGETHPRSKRKFSQCFVARVDVNYVRKNQLNVLNLVNIEMNIKS